MRSSMTIGAPRRANSSTSALTFCRNLVTLLEPLVICLSWLLTFLTWPREGMAYIVYKMVARLNVLS